MSPDTDIDQLLEDEYERGYDAGYADGYSSGESSSDGEYERGWDDGATDGHADGYADAKSDYENLVAVIRTIENDMFWTLKDGTADDHNALIGRVKFWHDRIREELEDAPL